MAELTKLRLMEILTEQAEVEMVTPEMRLKEDLKLDSLDLQEMFMDIEDEFQLDLPEKELDAVTTVDELWAALEKHLSTKT